MVINQIDALIGALLGNRLEIGAERNTIADREVIASADAQQNATVVLAVNLDLVIADQGLDARSDWGKPGVLSERGSSSKDGSRCGCREQNLFHNYTPFFLHPFRTKGRAGTTSESQE